MDKDLKELVVKSYSKILSDLAYRIIVDKKSGEEAFKLTSKSVAKQTGLSLHNSSNLVRMAVATYLGKEKYHDKALNSIDWQQILSEAD